MDTQFHNVLILNVQTSGLDPSKDEILEVACICYSLTDLACLEAHSWIINAECESNSAEHINGITSSMIRQGVAAKHIWGIIENLITECDAIVSVNPDWTKLWLKNFSALGNWADISWPLSSNSKEDLATICAKHRVPVVEYQKALDKCRLVAALLARCSELEFNLQGMLSEAVEAKVLFAAKVSFDQRFLAKEHGFQWDPEKRIWKKRLSPKRIGSLPFEVYEVAKGRDRLLAKERDRLLAEIDAEALEAAHS